MVAAERLKHKNKIENQNALTLIERYRRKNDLIYADPPYAQSTRGKRIYAHEMTDNDHVKLLNILNEHPGPVILSGYGCGLYDNRLLHRMKVARNARVESGQVKVEILWINSIAEKQIGRRLFDGLI